MARRAGVLALGMGLMLGACTPSDEEPSPTAEPTSESAPSSDEVTDEPTDERPEVDPPQRPAEMEEETVDGAIAAASYFVELYPYVYSSGDVTEWDALSDEGCEFCSNVRSSVSELHDSGGYSLGGETEIYATEGGGPYDEGVFDVELGVHFAASEWVHADGTRTSYEEGDKPAFSLSMAWRGGGWTVLGVLVDGDQA
ncbi:DUF6318 family protein [Ruania halotolerans]|uniref:DUF6318 family protein n=1 Tax=Ruania halotolerans TaxID=2897773 RepID=UPI001E3541AA|nr:DUF6318 family protein [Ruania halotolerans]UFU04995.1 DUF6318 family protein [Ruania halotolerans]